MTVTDYLNMTAFYIGTILITASALIYSFIQKHTKKAQNKIYIALLAITLIQAVLKIIYIISADIAGSSYRLAAAVYVCVFFYHVLHIAMPIMLYYYALFSTQAFSRFSYRHQIIGMMPFFVSELVTLTNPLTHLTYSFDENCNTIWHIGVYLAYAVALLYLAASMGVLFRWGHRITRERRKILIFAFSLTIIGVTAKLTNPAIDVELFSEALTFLGLMLAIEYDDEWRDAATGLYNRSAFLQDIRTFLEMRSSFYVVSVHFRNIELVRRFLGLSDSRLMGMISAVFKGLSYDMVYRVTPASFAVILPISDEREARRIAEGVLADFGEGEATQAVDIPLGTTVLYARVPDEMSEAEDILQLCEGTVPEKLSGGVLSGDDLKFLLQRTKLDIALHSGIREKRFRITYSPVYVAATYEIHSAEANVSLYDAELGDIPFESFAPIVEKNGMLREIGEYVLREVCAYLHGGEPQKLGIKHINIRVSPLLCLEPDFVDSVNMMVSRYGVHPRLINFELTDTVESEYQRELARVVGELKALGFVVSLEGYGRGYAAMYSIFSMDIDIIKIDREMIEEAQRSGDGRVVLENSVRMIHEMNKRVMASGIDTREQLELMRLWEVDYAEGECLTTKE